MSATRVPSHLTAGPTEMIHSPVNIEQLKYEPRHEKTNSLHIRKQRPRSNCEADKCLCYHFMDSTIPLLSKSKISSL